MALREYGGICLRGIFNKNEVTNFFNLKELYNEFDSAQTIYRTDINIKSYRDLEGPYTRGLEKNLTTNLFGKKKIISPDKGLVDVYKYKTNENQEKITECLTRLSSTIIESAFPNSFKPSSFFNLYLYKNVSTPRCFHRDGFDPHLKVFLILKDTKFLEHGPYAFHPMSYKNNYFKTKFLVGINRLFGSDLGNCTSDSTFCSFKNMFPFFSEIGDVLITRQDGTHGDFPATIPYEKAALIQNFFKI